MATFIVLASFSDQNIKNIKKSIERSWRLKSRDGQGQHLLCQSDCCRRIAAMIADNVGTATTHSDRRDPLP